MKTSASSSVVADPFTTRLVAVYQALVKSNVLKNKRGEFARACLLQQPFLIEIVKGERNFPADSAKRATAKSNLKAKWSVNPEYLEGNSQKMLLASLYSLQEEDPKKLADVAIGYETSLSLLQMLNECKVEISRLQHENSDLVARLAQLGAE